MAAETRNSVVVLALIVSMTAGARVLFWLEPGPRASGDASLLMAAGGAPAEEIRVSFLPLAPDNRDEFDLLILGDGQVDRPHADPLAENVRRLVVIGAGTGRLEEAQSQRLLAVLWGVSGPGRSRARVVLEEPADARLPEFQELRALLLFKGIIR